MDRRSRRQFAFARAAGCLAACWLAAPAAAQQPGDGTTPFAALIASDATAGSPTEKTFLLLGSLSRRGASASIRPLTPRQLELNADSAGIGWRPRAGRWLTLTTPTASFWHNASRPVADRDGAVWQGRGATASLTAGVLVEHGPLSFSLRPIAFSSENLGYTPINVAASVNFREPYWGGVIDLPYRFGARKYERLDPGESWLKLSAYGIGLGASTASQQWGPAHYYSVMLGTEAAGFPRVFLETRELNLFVGKLDAHWLFGRLEASPYANLTPGQRSRSASALLVGFTPHGLEGLQLGGTRFFHARWSPHSTTWEIVGLPLARLLKNTRGHVDIVQETLNQMASVYLRIAPPGSGAEAYGEFYREDHNVDLRDLAGEPDHESAYVIGMRKAWRAGGAIRAVTIENANGTMTHLSRIRGEFPMYIHSELREGHTYLGQPLGSTAIFEGGGVIATYDQVAERVSHLVQLEYRADGHDQEGGALDGSFSGGYYARLGRTRVYRFSTVSVFVTLERHFGLEKDSRINFAVRATSPR